MKVTLIIGLLFAFYSCGSNAGMQTIDLSDKVVVKPADGVGHYVYAMSIPETVRVGEKFEAQMEWRTVGGVDPNARYTMDVILLGGASKIYEIPAGANTVGELHLANWFSYSFLVPADFPAGEYVFGVRLRDAERDFRQVPLGFDSDLEMKDGFYRLASVDLMR